MRRLVLLTVCLLLLGTVCRGQTVVNDYVFSTGVDSSLWVDMTVSTPWQISGEVPIPLPFTFSIWNRDYDEVVVYPDGSMLFHCQMRSAPEVYFPDSVRRIQPVTSGLFGYRNASGLLMMQSTCLNLGVAGSQVWVMEMRNENVGGYTRYWQIRVAEEDNSLTVVYGPGTPGSYTADIGLMLDTGHVVVVNPSGHTVSPTSEGRNRTVWPGRYRWYRFEPAATLCATPTGLHIGEIAPDGTSVRMLWNRCSFYSGFRVEYGAPGFAEGTGTAAVVADTSMLIDGQTPESDVEVRVYGICGDTSSGYVSQVVHLERVVPSRLHGYVFTTGLNSQLWCDMSGRTSTDVGYHNLPFPVFVYDRFFYRQFVTGGPIVFNNVNPYTPYPSFPDMEPRRWYDTVEQIMAVYGFHNLSSGNGQSQVKIKCINPDSVGHRVLVVEQSRVKGCISDPLQVQLREDDHSVTIVYGEQQFPIDGASAVGMMFDTNRVAYIDQENHTVSPTYDGVERAAWPGQFRYYRFVPEDSLCPDPVLKVRGVSLTSDRTRLIWERCPYHNEFLVEYGPEGFAEGTGTRVTTTDTSLLLEGLLPEVDYEARVTALCPYGNTGWSSLVFRTPCHMPRGNRLHFANLYADSVKCCTGSYGFPSTALSSPNRVDYGPRSVYSRHTTHYDSVHHSYLDGRNYNYYGYSLPRPIPDGFCSSVKLGRYLGYSGVGPQQESITYTLVVDTNQYELLILHYALAQTLTKWLPDSKPRFVLDITDSAGNPLPGCFYNDFITEDLFQWSSNINYLNYWSGWDAAGVDLAPLHGRTIHVTLSHFDGYHAGLYNSDYLHGYAYFTLETARKRIVAESCGDGEENVFHAPKGFTYRWYKADAPNTTLSTAETLHVTVPGEYKCRLATRLGDQVCGFDLTAYAGGRYPVAAFAMQPLDSCGSLRRFSNQSVVSQDEDRTQLTTLPCDEYLWDFGDGGTSTDENPVHRFAEGSHTVTLYAMLAGGDCVDSVSQMFSVVLQHDTIVDSICSGQEYDFFGRRLTEAGVYTHVAGCQHSTLFLKVNPVFSTSVADTFATGEYYLHDGVRYRQPGIYTRLYTSVGGCDSTVTLHLSCIAFRDTTVCASSLPYVWHGVTFSGEGTDTVRYAAEHGADSIEVLTLHVVDQPELLLQPEAFCRYPGGYSLVLPYGLCYLWASEPRDTSLPAGWVRGSEMELPLRLCPRDTTRYTLMAQYCDSTPCPWRGVMLLAPVAGVEARLGVTPPQLTEDNFELTAVDLYPNPHERMWFINGTSVLSTDSFIVYRASPSEDSVRVMLVVTTPDCSDTAFASVPVKIQSLWFPNVFTPGEASNNLFRGYGVNVRDYDLKIFTRWGDCIFHTNNIDECWNGTYRGVPSPASAYVYLCRYTTLDGEPRVLSGTVTLLR